MSLSAHLFGQSSKHEVNLSGKWRFRMDTKDVGASQQWYRKALDEEILLPGSMTTNNLGYEVGTGTPWTGSIVDSSWFFDARYARYRHASNFKVPFWLQPVKYYKGAAWYQKSVHIPESWKNKKIQLLIERSHWETTVWLDDDSIGMQNSLGSPQLFAIEKNVKPGLHRLTIRIDNRIKDIDVGKNSHSVSDHTQGNWNGMIGEIKLLAKPLVHFDDIQVYPNINNNTVEICTKLKNHTIKKLKAVLQYNVFSNSGRLGIVTKNINIDKGESEIRTVYPMGENVELWDEFTPALYNLNAKLTTQSGEDDDTISFGMRKFVASGKNFAINNRVTFLRGTLECAIFPLTGFPPTDIDSWIRVIKIAKSYGLNHMRFHSWCPPEAAFDAADQLGFYLQVECSSWANQGATIGDGNPIDNYIFNESESIVKWFGNHPSFCMMAYGNEPAGKNQHEFLTRFVNYWKKRDTRRLYTSGAGWPILKESDFNSSPDPRIQAWGAGLKSIINSQPPRADYDWRKIVSQWDQPTVSHEIGQWCVFPDFKEIAQYSGILKPKNFEIFRDQLSENKLGNLADSFLLASGKLQVLCYKADIEAALRTPDFGGFQLLDLHDFPGQGTALVGVLNPFWREKGYVTSSEYSKFCNSIVPLVRFPKMIYLNNEDLIVPVEAAQFKYSNLANVTATWRVKDASDRVLFEGKLPKTNIPAGNNRMLGAIKLSLSSITDAQKLNLSVAINEFENSWDFFVYPAILPAESQQVIIKQALDAEAIKFLNEGSSVLLTFPKGTIKSEFGGDIQIGFSSIFWNTAWTHGQAPTTLGILCNPSHPALKHFPTEYHSNWQWWDGMSHSNALVLDSISPGLQPIVRVIDDWVTSRSLGLIFECRVGKGKLIVSSIDLASSLEQRPEARQLRYSILQYMESDAFNPANKIELEKITRLFPN